MMYISTMVRKQFYITEGQDDVLKDQARELGISEAELVRRALGSFLSEGSSMALRRPDVLDTLLERTRTLSEKHRLSSGYRFDREELYSERKNRRAESEQ